MLHLGDLPNAGYSTQRERELSDAMMTSIRELERSRPLLLRIVLDGLPRWRTVAKDAFGLQVETDAVDGVFRYLELLACKPAMQVRLLAAQQQPDVWRLLMAEAQPEIEAQAEGLRLMQKWSPHG